MATYVTPKRATTFIFYIGLVSQADTKTFQSNATLAAGDVKVSTDGSALQNLNTLPSVDPASSKLVKITVSASEMTGDNIQIIFSDAAGAEWCDCIINIQTTARQIDDLTFPTTSGRSLDVTATGAAGIDWGNIENQSTVVNLSATDTQNLAQLTATIADSVAADGSRPTPVQALLMITRFLMEKSLTGVTMTVNKENGATASMTFTLDSATAPTSITRAT